MPLFARSSLLAGAFAAGLAMVPLSQLAAEPGHDEIPTSITLLPESPIAAEPAAEEPAEPAISEKELTCLARVIDHEAANQPRDGQVAVGHVLLNRVRSSRFPNSFCAVAYQPRQFSYINKHRIREGSARWQTALDIARAVISGDEKDTSGGALFFHASYIKPNSFFRTRTKITSVEDHIFYR